MDTSNWIEEIQKQINEEEDQTLFIEAAGCLSSGFYRAGYVISWIAIVESLKRKIYESYNLGDKLAEKSYIKITEAEAKKISVDKIILEEAIQLRLVEDYDESKLNFLWEQRCIFAHPYSKAPKEDDLKYIITSAVEICLSKPLLYRKNYIDELSENLVSKPYFLTDDKENLKVFARRTIARIPSELHPYFFKTLLYKLGTIIDVDEKFKTQLRVRGFLIELFKLTPLELSINDWSLEHRAINFPYVCILGFVHPDIWDKVPDRIKDILIEYSITEVDENKQIVNRQIIGYLLKEDKLEGSYKKRFLKKLNAVDFKNAYSYYGKASSLYNRVLQEFDSSNYIRQNTVVDFIRDKDGQAFIAGLDQEKQINLGWKIMLSSRTNSWTAQSYLSELVNLKETTLGVKTGILFGSIITSNNFFYIKKDYLTKAIKIINKLEDDEINTAFDYLIGYINENNSFNELDEGEVESITNVAANLKEITLAKLSVLKEIMKKYCA